MIRYTLLLLAFLCANVDATAQNKRIHVSPNASGQQNGQSWADAYTDLQEAVSNSQAGDSIWVAAGVYRATSSNDRALSFEPKSGTSLFGGFAGHETSLQQRDWQVNASILDGDIGIAGDTSDNTYNIMYLEEPDSNTLVDGFCFRYGMADYAANDIAPRGRKRSGGALYIMGENGEAYPNIRNCRFEYNSANSYGGAVMVNGQTDASVAPEFVNCTFYRNISKGDGGAIYKIGSSWVDRLDYYGCDFVENFAARLGGGIYASDRNRSDSTQILNCRFIENIAKNLGASFCHVAGQDNGANILVSGCSFSKNTSGRHICAVLSNFLYSENIVLKDCSFDSNQITANSGNLISIDVVSLGFKHRMQIEDCNFISNRVKAATLFSEVDSVRLNKLNFIGDSTLIILSNGLSKYYMASNIQSIDCSAVFFILSEYISNISFFKSINIKNSATQLIALKDSKASIENCTVTGCSDIGTITGQSSTLSLKNSIFYNKGKPISLTAPSGAVEISHCFFDSLDCAAVNCGPGNLTGFYPMFRDTASGDYRLAPCSPLVNAGINPASPSALPTDLEGQPRIQGGTIDMGCYETPAPGLATAPAVSASCEGGASGSVSLVPINGCEPYAYAWANGSGPSPLIGGLSPGDYAITVTDARGSSFIATVSVPAGAAFSAMPAAVPVQCGDTIGGSIAWAIAGGGQAPFAFHWPDGSAADSLSQNLAPGQYVVTVTDARGCTTVGTASIGTEGGLNIEVTGNGVSCFGEADGSFTVLPLNGKAPFQWLWGDGSQEHTLDSLAAGQYEGTLTDAFGCNIAWTFPLSEPQALGLAGSVAAATDSVMGNGSIVLDTIFGGTQPYSMLWSNGQSGTQINDLVPDTYTVTVSDDNGCSASATFTVPFTVSAPEPGRGLVRVWPNPFSSVFVLEKSGELSGNCLLILHDGLGRLLKSVPIEQASTIVHAGNLPPGAYTWKLMRGGLVVAQGVSLKVKSR